jgi:ATPases of the AAA+ class
MIYIQYKKVFDELDRCFSAARCKLLLYGPPGTGKSYAAKFFARKWGVKLHIYSPSAILSKYLGETEQNLREALDHARRGDAVLLDEFEIFAMQREKVAEMKIATVQVLLTELQELNTGIVIATTNADPSLIDPPPPRRQAEAACGTAPDPRDAGTLCALSRRTARRTRPELRRG